MTNRHTLANYPAVSHEKGRAWAERRRSWRTKLFWEIEQGNPWEDWRAVKEEHRDPCSISQIHGWNEDLHLSIGIKFTDKLREDSVLCNQRREYLRNRGRKKVLNWKKWDLLKSQAKPNLTLWLFKTTQHKNWILAC